MSPGKKRGVRVDGVRYVSVAEAARAIECKANSLGAALIRGAGSFRGYRIEYDDETALSRAIRLAERRRKVIAVWYERHKFEHDAPRKRQAIQPGERLLRPRMLGPGEARG